MGLERNNQSYERQGPTSKITLRSKAIIEDGRADKCFPDKIKEFIITKPLLYEMLKGLIWEKEDDQKYEQWNDNKLTTINNWT